MGASNQAAVRTVGVLALVLVVLTLTGRALRARTDRFPSSPT
ncbi:hypothetical protein [Streptomyces sp. NPDC048436]